MSCDSQLLSKSTRDCSSLLCTELEFVTRAMEKLSPSRTTIRVSEQHFIHVSSAMTRGVVERADLHDIFSRFDFDRNGRMSQQVVKIALKEVYKKGKQEQHTKKRHAQIRHGLQYLSSAFSVMRERIGKALSPKSARANNRVAKFDSLEAPGCAEALHGEVLDIVPTCGVKYANLENEVPGLEDDDELSKRISVQKEEQARRSKQRQERLLHIHQRQSLALTS